MYVRSLVLALALWLTACSNAPTKQAGPTTSGPPPTQQPAGSTPAPSRGDTVDVGRNPLKDPGDILYRRSVFFDYDDSSIKDSDRPLLEAHASYLQRHPAAKVTVQGNADERGSREYNIALGQRRADAVKRVLTVLGAADRQIETVSFGKEKPRCVLSEESCWSENRRADLVYADD